MPFLLILIICSSLIILGLAGYAAILWYQVWQRKRPTKHTGETLDQRNVDAMETAAFNINFLLRALDQGQVSLTEGASRIVAFLPALPEYERQSEWYAPFRKLAYATSHIPILENWQSLTRAQKRKFDDERAKLEDEHRKDIIDAVRILVKPGLEN